MSRYIFPISIQFLTHQLRLTTALLCRDWMTTAGQQKSTCGVTDFDDVGWKGTYSCSGACTTQECCVPKTCKGVHLLLKALIQDFKTNKSDELYELPDCENEAGKSWDDSKALTSAQVATDPDLGNEYKWAIVDDMIGTCCVVLGECADVAADQYDERCQDAGMTRFYWDTTKTCSGADCSLRSDCCVAKKCRDSINKNNVTCPAGTRWNDNFPLGVDDEGDEEKKCCLVPRKGAAAGWGAGLLSFPLAIALSLALVL